MQNANEASLSEQEASQVTNLRTQSSVQGMNLLGCRYTYLLLLSRAVYLPPSLPTSWPNPAARPDSPWGPTPREPSASSLLRQSTSLPPAHLTTPPSAPGRKRTKREGAERNIKQKLRSPSLLPPGNGLDATRSRSRTTKAASRCARRCLGAEDVSGAFGFSEVWAGV